MFDTRLETFHRKTNGYWAKRIFSELEYAHEVSKIFNGKFDGVIDEAITYLTHQGEDQGSITKEIVVQVEGLLSPLSGESKQFKLICAAHAHIDMNWMWRWDETVSVTLDTFRTMLRLMEEYPDFKFSQSQASVYQIVETYAPEMLEEIKERVKEGRWEVTASTWVEADKNLPNGESQARHLLYTRQYLSQLLGLEPEAFKLDFEPDTFGHHANVPEILSSGGVRYYYHCRGDEGEFLYRWKARSGRSILVYREPTWYLGNIEPEMAVYVPSFCHQYGIKTALKVYGVGDHGGGPTRRDIERIIDMATWPIFPTLQFGTFADFYKQVEIVADQLPQVEGELNFVFTGCYTSQTRIKRANRIAEAALHSAELFSSLAAVEGFPYPTQQFTDAWTNTLFNQFHDIIPGSGVIDTREYALGLFQKTMALAVSQKSRAYHALTSKKDQPTALEGKVSSIAEGAGVGFGIDDFKISQVSRGGGKTRNFYIFNPSFWPRKEVIELIVWDWDGDLERMCFYDVDGRKIQHQILDHGVNNYWGHQYVKVLAAVDANACGYTAILLKKSDTQLESLKFPLDPRVEKPVELILENEFIKAVFNPQSCGLTSLIDKSSGINLIKNGKTASFRRIQEDDRMGMTAWTVGRYMDVDPLNNNVRLISYAPGSLRQSLSYEVKTGDSKLAVTISLDDASRGLDYAVECDWHEIGRHGEGVPQLNYFLPINYACRAYRYDIPFGTVDREPAPMDVPANSWGFAVPETDDKSCPAVQLMSDSSYGFRGVEDSLALTLIRSSYDPDPYPEIGIHKMSFRINILTSYSNQELIAKANDFTHPLDILSGAGDHTSAHSYIVLESGSVAISAIKAPEDGADQEMVIRVYETNGMDTRVNLKFDRTVRKAVIVNIHEEPILNKQDVQVESDQISFGVGAYQVMTVRIALA